MALCIPPKVAETLLSELSPEKLASMDTKGRRAYLTDKLGQELGNKVHADLNRAFYKGNIEPSKDQVKKIMELQDVALKAERELLKSERRKGAFDATEKEMAYGRSQNALDDYIATLKAPAPGLKQIAQMTYKHPGKFIQGIGAISKSLKSAFDMSATFNQGLKSWLRDPKRAFKDTKEGFRVAFKALGDAEAKREFDAVLRSHPLYEEAIKHKLAIGVIEEAYPAQNFMKKVPILGQLYRASEQGFSATLQAMRMDTFAHEYAKIKAAGGDTTGLGLLVNSQTGRGDLTHTLIGNLEPISGTLNNWFFSPKKLQSVFDTFLQPFDRSGRLSKDVKRAAMRDMLHTIGGIATILTISKMMQPDSVEEDPRSADFGKIRVGDTRFDVSGGSGSLITLAMRLATMSSKSTTTGQVSKINSGEYGGQTGIDVLVNFAENKLSPAASVLKDLLENKTYQGEKPTLSGEALNLITPLPVATAIELYRNPNSANFLVAQMLDMLGIIANTYSPTSNWDSSSAKAVNEFKSKVSSDTFKQANNDFNLEFQQWFSSIRNNQKYTSLTQDRQQQLIKNKKADIQEKVFKKYGYRFKKIKSKPLPKL
jgi:hypothetical protein